MNKLTASLAVALVGLSTATFAAESSDPGSDAARQARMDQAYRDHQAQEARRPGLAERTETATKRDAHKVGHAISNGFHKTGEAIHRGAEKTSEAFHRNVHPSEHAVHESTDKVTDHP